MFNSEKVKEFRDFLQIAAKAEFVSDGYYCNEFSIGDVICRFDELCNAQTKLAPHVIRLYKCTQCGSCFIDREEANKCCNNLITDITVGMNITSLILADGRVYYVAAISDEWVWIREVGGKTRGFWSSQELVRRDWRKS